MSNKEKYNYFILSLLSVFFWFIFLGSALPYQAQDHALHSFSKVFVYVCFSMGLAFACVGIALAMKAHQSGQDEKKLSLYVNLSFFLGLSILLILPRFISKRDNKNFHCMISAMAKESYCIDLDRDLSRFSFRDDIPIITSQHRGSCERYLYNTNCELRVLKQITTITKTKDPYACEKLQMALDKLANSKVDSENAL